MRRAIYPGTFDPITNGHLDIIKRACSMFDEIIVAVAASEAKKPMFTLEQRIQMAQDASREFPKITVIGFDKLLVDLSDDLDANIVVRGLRAVSDFEYELQMGYANASLKKELETIYLMPSLQHAFVSSSVVRAILAYDGKVDHLLPETTYRMIREYRK
ncbi:Phosphopantetheine adenylyltransferase [hydrothermal vent metagenome]|uniref:Phosphopantetheine adenylyltransferase n=1 Tax=hydrothermal vent metagenome TaxID=652676 RepID=A0A1W1CRA4_9ZZZZ